MFVFIAIPKTGTSSLSRILNEIFPDWTQYNQDRGTFEKNRTKAQRVANIGDYSLVYGHLTLKDVEELGVPIGRSRIFTLLRDPLQRCMSGYKYGVKMAYRFLKNKEKNDFYDYYYPLHLQNGRPISFYDYMTNENLPINDQMWWATGKTGISVDEAISIVEQNYDLVGILEYFDSFISLLRIKYGWTIPDSTIENWSRIKIDDEDITRTVPIIEKTYRNDFLFYEYFKDKLIKQLLDIGADRIVAARSMKSPVEFNAKNGISTIDGDPRGGFWDRLTLTVQIIGDHRQKILVYPANDIAHLLVKDNKKRWNLNIMGVADSYKEGYIEGYSIIHPKDLNQVDFDAVIIASSEYGNEIRDTIESHCPGKKIRFHELPW